MLLERSVVPHQGNSSGADCRDGNGDGDSVVVDELLRGGSNLLDAFHYLSFHRDISHYIECILCEEKKENAC